MQPGWICVLVLVASVNAAQYRFNAANNPIKVVGTSIGQGGRERLVSLYAQIYPRHLTNNERVSFPRSGDIERYFRAISAPGDERGHLVASQFSGPPIWQNLSPQSPVVNRNAGMRSLTTDWYNTECEVRRFLEKGGNRYVIWTVQISYVGDSNRPNQYHLQVAFQNDDAGSSWRPIDARMPNPFRGEQKAFYVCNSCGRKRRRLNKPNKGGDDEKDELRRRRRRRQDRPEYDMCFMEWNHSGFGGRK